LSKMGGEVIHLGQPAHVLFTSLIYISFPKSPPQNPSTSCFTFPRLCRPQRWSRWPEVSESITQRSRWRWKWRCRGQKAEKPIQFQRSWDVGTKATTSTEATAIECDRVGLWYQCLTVCIMLSGNQSHNLHRSNCYRV
jgi:hypothetical protein